MQFDITTEVHKGIMKISQVQEMVPPQQKKVKRRKRKTRCFNDPDTKNITPREKLKIRK